MTTLLEQPRGFTPVEGKLHAPVRPHGTIERPRLVRLLADPDGPPIVAVVAPPGYGKSTLLAAWLAADPRPAAWLTLDELDNDPATLVTYLATTLSRIGPMDPALLSGLPDPGDPFLGTIVPRIARAIHDWRRPFVLVVDDAHRIVDRAALDVITTLLHNLPEAARVVIAGRSEPDLGLARMRVERRLLDIESDMLALDLDETAAVAMAAGSPLDDEEVQELVARTEGWPAAVYLAALAGSRERAGTGGAVAAASGSDRYIADYLHSEVELTLDEEDFDFLTRTSILETVDPEVAAAITGLQDAGERLRRLARRILFIHQVVPETAVYRYHHLLREYLAASLARRQRAAIPELHRRASDWHAEHGHVELAVEHALRSGDRVLAARRVSAATATMVDRGMYATMDRWLLAFSVADVERMPPLAVSAAWMHALAGRAADALRMADIADRGSFEGSSPDGTASFEVGRATLRAFLCRRGVEDMRAEARRAVEGEPPSSRWRGLVLLLEAACDYLDGEHESAEALLERVPLTAVPAPGAIMVALALQASLRSRAGDWESASRLAAEAERQVAPNAGRVTCLLVHAVAARVAVQRGDLPTAHAALARAQLVRPRASHASPWLSVAALLELARAYLALSDPAGAHVVIREAQDIVGRRPSLGVLTGELADLRARLAGASATLAGSSVLTAAELRVLPFMPTYLSFEEIGDRLMISRNTVKSHAMSIYTKLWATSRGEAVERAVELGLLEPFPGLEIGRVQPGEVPTSGMREPRA